MQGMLRSIRLPVVLLFLCTPARVDAQQFVCWPIAAGDTAASLARRLTGNASAAYGLAFQIRDPARQMFVPKSHYQRLQSDWQACVAPGPAPNTPIVRAPVVEMAAASTAPDDSMVAATPMTFTSAPPAAVATVTRPPGAIPIAHVPLGQTIGAALVMIIFMAAAAGSLAPRLLPPDARRDGENFVAVFARPLIDPGSSGPPIETRLRFRRRQQQLEISIAPSAGRRYPNLADHKKNVEYDIDRVLGVLGNYVQSKPPRANGKWIVVTITKERQS